MNSQHCLIGYSGYVGSALLRQSVFKYQYNSRNIRGVAESGFDICCCAAAPAQKWIANKDPESDRTNIVSLTESLREIRCRMFVLISTVDVFKRPLRVDEETEVVEEGLHPYGVNRRYLEKFVAAQFKNHLIVRLPGLVGPGLRKNIVFDLLNDNNLHLIDSRAVFQFYPMVNLWFDIQRALREELRLVHLTAEPISVREVAEAGFNRTFEQIVSDAPAAYDMQSRFAAHFGGAGRYQYNRRESLQAIRGYAQSESRTLPATNGAAG